MYLQHFGLKHEPLSSYDAMELPQFNELVKQSTYLLETKRIGVVTGEAGTGKTTALKKWCETLNPLTHKIIYQSDNHFRPFDIYGQLADSLGLEKYHRYSKLWRCLKDSILDLHDHKQTTLVWILDEAHQLPHQFILQLPAFLNFSFDSRNIMLIILCGLPSVQNLLKRTAYDAIASRVQFFMQWQPIDDPKQFADIVDQAFKYAGKQETIMTESGVHLIHLASKGRLRHANRLLTRALQLAAQQNLNHLPDEIINRAIDDLRI